MIRHLTSEDSYNSIIKDGIIKPREKEGRDKGVVSFETFKGNNNFVEVFKNGKKFSGGQLVGIFIDEKKLQNENFKLYVADSSSVYSRQNSKYTTKYENITKFSGEETNPSYISIGEYIHVEGEIPIKYIERIERY